MPSITLLRVRPRLSLFTSVAAFVFVKGINPLVRIIPHGLQPAPVLKLS